MSLNESQLYALINQYNPQDPLLKEILRQFVSRFGIVYQELFPASSSTSPQEDAEGTTLGNVESFTYELLPAGIKFEWTRPSADAILFEIRKGNTWDTGSRQIVTSTLSAILDGQAIGTHKYWIKAINILGNESPDALSIDVIIPALGSFIVTGTVIDNFALLYWTVPTSAFRIDYYIVYKNGNETGRQPGTFTAIFENAQGTYLYGIQAVDIFGNVSSIASKEFEIAQPADYVLEAIESDDLSGTRTNVLLSTLLPSLLACIDLAETWSDYASNGYSTLQDEIDDNLPYWLQPTLPTGEYEQVIDYGAVYDEVNVTADWNQIEIVPNVTVDIFLSTSLDNITYTSEINAYSIYAPTLRYVKIRIEFTALN